jgi:aconitate hydratase
MFDFKMIEKFYTDLPKKINDARAFFKKPLTLTEKILYGHLADIPSEVPEHGKTYTYLNPDRVAMQDATAQMALLQFMSAKREKTAVPTTVHCDHLITALSGADEDLKQANITNKEVYEFLSSVSQKYSIGFWKPGAGIIHQVVLENYAFPGGLMVGTDSHTVNAGGLGMIAIGVGGADAVDVMAGMPWELRWPGIIGVKLTGELNGWTSAKDIILKLAGILTVKGGTGKIVEYFGEGTKSISTTGKATITNMGAEIGATTSIFPIDKKAIKYLELTGRSKITDLIVQNEQHLNPDREVLNQPEKYYDQLIEIYLNDLEPHIVGPFTPDLARPISKMKEAIRENDYIDDLSAGLIGSCTNSSYEDLERSADIAQQALDLGLKSKCEFLISPGSEQIRATVDRDGQLDKLRQLGGTILANACGPCIGQWNRPSVPNGTKNSIISSFNRNFARRNDGNPETFSFISSPEIVTALSVAGKLSFNPLTDTITDKDGNNVKLNPPTGNELPSAGYEEGNSGYVAPNDDGRNISIKINKDSERLQLLEPFGEWNGEDYGNLKVLLKAKGKCTTDHISPAGHWLRFRGHIDNISDNLFSGAVNAFTDEVGKGTNVITSERGIEFNKIARDYRSREIGWVAIGDQNYGEGSSREHAAMEPRFLGCKVVITKSFARIHETNLKKQGILPLTFVNPKDYDLILENDTIFVEGIKILEPASILKITVNHSDGSKDIFDAKHTMSSIQIKWFKHGSALNMIAAQN